MEKFWPFESFYKKRLNISEEETQQIKLFIHNFKNSIDSNQITTYKKINPLTELQALKKLKNQIEEFLNDLNLDLDENWIQLYKKENFHLPHTHVGSAYSGVIYIDGKTNEGTSFLDPQGNIYTSEFIKNDLILFPSHIIHYVNFQQTDTNRIIISFNTKRRR